MLQSNPGCVSVCASVRASVRLCVCVISTAQTNEQNLMKLSIYDISDIFASVILRGFWYFEFNYVMSAIFLFCRCGILTIAILVQLSSNFQPKKQKKMHKVLWCSPVFAIENQQDRPMTFGNTANWVWQKFETWAQNSKCLKAGKISFDFD